MNSRLSTSRDGGKKERGVLYSATKLLLYTAGRREVTFVNGRVSGSMVLMTNQLSIWKHRRINPIL